MPDSTPNTNRDQLRAEPPGPDGARSAGGPALDEDWDDADGDAVDQQPDVLLDVPVLKVDEISLEVDDLQARVSLQAEVLDLLRLRVGADVSLGRVSLQIKGVEAAALLKVRLDNVAAILDRVMATIDDNPQILADLTRGVGEAASRLGEGAAGALEEVGEGAGGALEEVGEGAGGAVEEVGEGAGGAVKQVGEGAGGAVKQVGEGAGSAVGSVGDEVGRAEPGPPRRVRRDQERGKTPPPRARQATEQDRPPRRARRDTEQDGPPPPRGRPRDRDA